MALPKNATFTGGRRATSLQKGRSLQQKHQQQQHSKQHHHRYQLRSQGEPMEEDPMFCLPGELQLAIFHQYFDGTTHSPIIRGSSMLVSARAGTRDQFKITPVDEAILASSNQAAAIWLDALVDWFEHHHRVVVGSEDVPWGLDGDILALRFAQWVRSKAIQQLPPGSWGVLCRKLVPGSRLWPSRLRDLELTLTPAALWGIMRPENRRGGIPGFTLERLLVLVPKVERLHLKMRSVRMYSRMVLAVKDLLVAQDPRFEGLKVAIAVRGEIKEELTGCGGHKGAMTCEAWRAFFGSYARPLLAHLLTQYWMLEGHLGVPPELHSRIEAFLAAARGTGLKRLVLDFDVQSGDGSEPMTADVDWQLYR